MFILRLTKINDYFFFVCVIYFSRFSEMSSYFAISWLVVLVLCKPHLVFSAKQSVSFTNAALYLLS